VNPASSCRTTMNDDTTIDNTAADDTTTTANAADDVTLSWRRSLFSALGYHLYTIYLFTYSSHKDVIYPGLVFSLSTALSSRSYLPLSSSPSPLEIIPRTPYALLQIYLSLLLFSLHNQHHPSSILEDTINKPWRPLPAGRISPSQTRLLLILGVYPLFLAQHIHWEHSFQRLVSSSLQYITANWAAARPAGWREVSSMPWAILVFSQGGFWLWWGTPKLPPLTTLSILSLSSLDISSTRSREDQGQEQSGSGWSSSAQSSSPQLIPRISETKKVI